VGPQCSGKTEISEKLKERLDETKHKKTYLLRLDEINTERFEYSLNEALFVKHDVSMKNPCSDLGDDLPEKLAVLNLIKKSNKYTNTDDSKVNAIVQHQIQKYQTNEKIRRKWENTRTIIICLKYQMKVFFYKLAVFA
jgi:hypothetical protein